MTSRLFYSCIATIEPIRLFSCRLLVLLLIVVRAVVCVFSERSFAQESAEGAARDGSIVARVHPLAGYSTEVGLLACVVRADQLGAFLAGRGLGQAVVKAAQNPSLVHVSLLTPGGRETRAADIFFTLGISNFRRSGRQPGLHLGNVG